MLNIEILKFDAQDIVTASCVHAPENCTIYVEDGKTQGDLVCEACGATGVITLDGNIITSVKWN